VKNVRPTLCTLRAAKFFTRGAPEVLYTPRHTKGREKKVTTGKRQNRAGATPLFCGFAAQKFRGVAPALRHECSCRPFCRGHKS
jgi:hypothetical protein